MRLKLLFFLFIICAGSCKQSDSIAKYRKLKRLGSVEIIERAKNKQFNYHYAAFKNVHGEALSDEEKDQLARGQLAKDYYIDKMGQIVEVRVRPLHQADKFLEIQLRGLASYQPHDTLLTEVNCDNLTTVIEDLVKREKATYFNQNTTALEDSIIEEKRWKHFENMAPIRNKNQKMARFILAKCEFPDTTKIGQENMDVFLRIVRNADYNIMAYYYDKIEKAAKSGKLDKKNFAVIQDRLLMYNGFSQIYGSQVSRGELYDLEKPRTVNKRRAAVGLKPIEEYLESLGLNFEEEIRRMGES